MKPTEGEQELAKNTKTPTNTRTRLKLSEVVRRDDLRMRVDLDDNAIREYADKYRRLVAQSEGDATETPFPLCIVVRTPEGLVLVDGWHRCGGMELAGITEYDFEVRDGSLRDAAIFAAEANHANNSVRLTDQDKRRTFDRLYAILGPETSSRELARYAGIDKKTAERWRSDGAELRRGKDGKMRRLPIKEDPTGDAPQFDRGQSQATAASDSGSEPPEGTFDLGGKARSSREDESPHEPPAGAGAPRSDRVDAKIRQIVELCVASPTFVNVGGAQLRLSLLRAYDASAEPLSAEKVNVLIQRVD